MISLTDNCYDLICKMLTLNPMYRISCKELLLHPYFSENPIMSSEQFSQFVNETHEFYVRKTQQQNKEQLIADKNYENQDMYLGNKREKDNKLI